MFRESYMNVSQYSPSRRLEREAIGSIDSLPSVKAALSSREPSKTARASDVRVVRSGAWETDDAVLRYSIDGLERCIIDRCEAKGSALAVPELIDGCPVAVIGGHSFSTCYGLARISLPPGVEEIREHAFMNTALEGFDAPESLRFIGAKAFYRCEHLTGVRLNEDLCHIGEGAFRESALEGLEVPARVNFIGRDAFKGTRLAFTGEGATLSVASGNERFGISHGSLYAATERGLVLVQVLDEDVVEYDGPDGLVCVGSRAFSEKRNLRAARLPEGVLSIGDAAFKGCTSLQHVSLPDTLRSIGKRAFFQTALVSLRIPRDLETVGAEGFYTGGTVARDFRQSIRVVEVAPGNGRFYIEEDTLCQRLGEGAIALLHFGCGSHIVIPRSVTAIGPYAFLNSKNATHITMHDGIGDIDVGGLDFGRALSTVVFETSGEQAERYVIEYPPGDATSQMARITFAGGNFDVALAYADCDYSILHARDLFTRSRMMVERLMNPVHLSPRSEAMFASRLKTAVPDIVVEFGRNGHVQGIDALFELGFIDEGNIQQVIDASIDAGEVEAVSRLVEIRHARFGMPLFDFEV